VYDDRAVALRRVPPHGWTVTARRDILTAEQHTALARYHQSLTADQATALLGALAFGHTDDYADWRHDHLDAEHVLKVSGVLHAENGPHRVQVATDVRYSLYRNGDPPPCR